MCQVPGTGKSHDLCLPFSLQSFSLLDKKSIVVKGIRYDLTGYNSLFLIAKKKQQLVALGSGGSAMPLEGACAGSFASLWTAFVCKHVS